MRGHECAPNTEELTVLSFIESENAQNIGCEKPRQLKRAKMSGGHRKQAVMDIMLSVPYARWCHDKGPFFLLCAHFTLVFAHSIRQVPGGFFEKIRLGWEVFCLRAYLLSECLEGRCVDGASDVDVYRCGVAGRGRRARNPRDLGEMVVYGHRGRRGDGRGHGWRQIGGRGRNGGSSAPADALHQLRGRGQARRRVACCRLDVNPGPPFPLLFVFQSNPLSL